MDASMRFVRLAVVLVVLGLAAVVAGAASTGAAGANGKGPSAEKLAKLKAQARGTVTVSTESSTSYLGFVRATPEGDLLPGGSATPQGKAQEFMAEYASLLGVEGAGTALVSTSRGIDRQGSTHVTYRQVYKGVPVFGATIKAHVDETGALTSVNGTAVPNIDLSVAPKLSAAQAGERAIAQVIADPPRSEGGGAAFLTGADLTASARLFVYRMGLVRGLPGTNQLVYEVEVTNGKSVREFVYLHAHSGKMVNRYSGVDNALFRRLYEMNTGNQIWQEGDSFPAAR